MPPATAEPSAKLHLAPPPLCNPRAAVCNRLRTGARVLFLVDQLTELGGGERVLLTLARELTRLGIQVEVVCFRAAPDPAAFRLFEPITFLPFAGCFRLQALRTALRLRALIRSRRFTIAHTFFETADTFGALTARISGVRHIVSSRRDMGILRSRKHRIAYRLLAPLYSAVVTVSDTVRLHHTQADRLRPRRVHTIHNGLDLSKFRPAPSDAHLRSTLGLPAHVPLVTTVANINAWKGLDTFLETAALVHQSFPSAFFVIAGRWSDPALARRLHRQADKLALAQHVRFLGATHDVPALLRNSSVMLLLSRSEGFPNVVLEAMACGTPTVATAVGGTPEAVQHGITGYLVAPGRPEEAAARTLSLLLDESLRARMSTAGLRRVQDEFSLDTMISKHLELYADLLDPRAR